MTVKSSMPISEAESIVMQVFWERGALASEDVVSALKSHGKWQESTVKTLLNRLLKKGTLGPGVGLRRAGTVAARRCPSQLCPGPSSRPNPHGTRP